MILCYTENAKEFEKLSINKEVLSVLNDNENVDIEYKKEDYKYEVNIYID